MKVRVATIALSFFTLSSTANATDLGDAAAAMAPGTWVELQTQDIVPILGWGPHTGNILPFAFTGIWDPLARRIIFYGTDHNGGMEYLVEYDDDTNTWATGIAPPVGWSHGYDHLAIDPGSGELYHRSFGNSLNLWSYTPLAASWVSLGSPPANGYVQVAIGLEYIEGMGLVIYNSGEPGGELYVYDPGTDTVTDLITGFGGESTYHSYIDYSPVKEVAVFGGGNANGTSIWRLNSDKTVTQLDDAPLGIGVTQANVTHDPGTGDFLVFGDGLFYQLDPAGGGTWAQLTGDAAPPPTVPSPPESLISSPITSYNVNAYVTCVIADCRMHLYKHSNVEPPPPGSDTGDSSGDDSDGSTGATADDGGNPTSGPGGDGADGGDATPGSDGADDGGGGADGGGDSDETGGCSCRSTPTTPLALLTLLALLATRRRLELRV